MAKNGVAGVLDGDPREDPGAKLIPALTHLQAIERGLKVMDTTALSLCMDNRLPIHVFELAPGDRQSGSGGACRHDHHYTRRRRTVIENFIGDATQRMDKSVEATHEHFNSVRTGRASRRAARPDPGRLLRHSAPHKNLATINSPESRGC